MLVLGIVLVGLALLFPPSRTSVESYNIDEPSGLSVVSSIVVVDHCFGFLDYENPSYSIITAELLMIALTTGILIYAFRPRKAHHPS